jgi:hypothetical protein
VATLSPASSRTSWGSSLLDTQERQVPLGVGQQAVVAEPFGGGQGAVEVVLGLVDVAGGRLQPAGQQQAGRPLPWGGVAPGGLERAADAGGSGDPVAEHHPGPAEPVGQAQAQPGVVGGGPGQGAVDVGSLGADQGEAVGLGPAADGGGAPVGGLREPGGVGGVGVIDLARLREAGAGEGADAVQEPVAGGAVLGGLDAQHGPVGEPADHVDRRAAGNAQRGEDMLGRGQGRPAGEAGQRPEASLVVGEQQVVAPGDGGGEGAASFGAPAGGVLEQREAVVEAPGDLPHRQRLDPGGGQLDRQGQAVEGPADGLDGGGGVVVEREPPARPGRAVGEQRHRVGQGQRVQRIQGLAVDPERCLAGGEDPEGPGLVQQPGGKVGGAVDDVLAVVEDQHRLGPREAVEQRLLAAGELQRLGHQLEDRAGRVRHLEPDQPDPAGGMQGADDLKGGPGLADDQGRGRRGGGRSGVEDGALAQDLALQVAQDRSGLDAELVDEQPAHPLGGGQGVGLPAGAVQGGDVGRPQAFAQRVLADQPFELGEHLGAAAEVDPGGRPVLEQAEPDLVQTCPVGLEPLAVAGVDQDLAAEQAERLGGRRHRRGRVASASCRGRGRGQADHLEGVDPAGVERKGVAPVAAADQGRLAKGPAQLGHLRLQGVPARAGGGRTPQVVDQPLGGHELAGVQRQPDQHLGGPAGRHRERPPVTPHLQRAEHPDGEHAPRVAGGPEAPSARRQRIVSGPGDRCGHAR